MRKIFLFLWMIQVFPLLGQDRIPLQTAIENGLKINYDLQNQYLEESSIRNQKLLAKKSRLFSLDFGSSYLYQSEKMKIQFDAMPLAPGMSFPGFSKEVGALNNYDVKLSLTQPLYTGGILSASIKKEELREAAEKSKTQLKRSECSGKIKSSYFTYHLYVQKENSLSKLLENLNLHLHKIEDFYAEDLVRKSDVLETQKQIEETRIQLEDLQQLIQTEAIQFQTLCGYEPGKIDDSYRELSKSLEESITYFRQHHPMLNALEQQANMMNIQKRMVVGKYLPQVAGFAEAHYGKPGIDYFSNEWGHYFRGGVNISLPIFHWNQRRQELAIPDIARQKILNQKADFMREIEKQLRQLYASKDVLEKKVIHLEKVLSIADEDAEIKDQLYQENQISHIDYLSALTVKERYQSMLHEVNFQIQLIDVTITTLIGYQE